MISLNEACYVRPADNDADVCNTQRLNAWVLGISIVAVGAALGACALDMSLVCSGCLLVVMGSCFLGIVVEAQRAIRSRLTDATTQSQAAGPRLVAMNNAETRLRRTK